MKNSIISDIFYGNHGQNEKIKHSKEYYKQVHAAAQLRETLEKTIADDQKEQLEKLRTSELGIESETALTYFTEGFKFGLLLGIEVVKE